MKARLIALSLVLAAAPAAAAAADITIEIRWTGTEPASVHVNYAGGTRALDCDSQRKLCRGTITVTGAGPERRIVTVRYGSFSHPIDIRVHRVSPPISFTVGHQIQTSCTDGKVRAYGQQSDNLFDAIDRTIGAGQLLAIGEPNACDRPLRLTAAQARYRQNVRMSQLSGGLFLVNEEIKNEYRQLAGAQGLAVMGEIEQYAADEARLEAVQLVAARDAALQSEDLASALAINDYLMERIASDVDAQAAFAQAGITRSRLLADSRFLNSMPMMEASQEAQASPMDSQN